jgi:hypothetical protein
VVVQPLRFRVVVAHVGVEVYSSMNNAFSVWIDKRRVLLIFILNLEILLSDTVRIQRWLDTLETQPACGLVGPQR